MGAEDLSRKGALGPGPKGGHQSWLGSGGGEWGVENPAGYSACAKAWPWVPQPPTDPQRGAQPQVRQHLPQGRLESAVILLRSQGRLRQLWKCPPNVPTSRRRWREQACLWDSVPPVLGSQPLCKGSGTPSLASPTPSPDKQQPPLRRLQGQLRPGEDRAHRVPGREYILLERAAQSWSERAGQRCPQPAEGCRQSPQG